MHGLPVIYIYIHIFDLNFCYIYIYIYMYETNLAIVIIMNEACIHIYIYARHLKPNHGAKPIPDDELRCGRPRMDKIELLIQNMPLAGETLALVFSKQHVV